MVKVKQLNAKQVEILQWVADGCPDDQYDDGFAHRIVARALEGRGLVSIKGRGATWHATITDDGTAGLNAPVVVANDVELEASELQLLWDRIEATGGSIRLDFAAESTD